MNLLYLADGKSDTEKGLDFDNLRILFEDRILKIVREKFN